MEDGDGSQTRSFCYVTDMIDAFVKLMDMPDEFTGPVNLGNPSEFSILQLAHEIIRLTGSKSKIVHRPLPQDDPVQRQPDISLARKSLNWNPRVKLADGLVETIAYFRQLLSDMQIGA
jgi:UDP-glucuronate decarboxylase